MSTYPFKCDLCGGVTDAPTYGDFKCQHCGQVYVYDECHRIELSAPQLKTLRDSRWIPVRERLPEVQVAVLGCCCGEIGVCKRFSCGWYWDEEYSHQAISPTHWMPLPEPPAMKSSVADVISHAEPKGQGHASGQIHGCLVDHDPYRPEPPEVK